MKGDALNEAVFFSTVRITASVPGGTSIGTGFLVAHPVDREKGIVFLVTNKHVVANAAEGGFSITLKKPDGSPDLGKRHEFTVAGFSQAWVGHPDPDIDVTVMNVAPLLNSIQAAGYPPFARWINTNDFATDERCETQFEPIEDVVFVGYPVGLHDSKNHLPIARRGTTASPPALDYEGQPTFLIDASVFPGSSGSPVIICNVGGYAGRGGFQIGSRFCLLGILARSFFQETTGEWKQATIPTVAPTIALVVKQMIDLGVVYKARTILETIREYLRVHPVA